MIQLCQAVRVIHAAEIVHRDIKPENIFLHGASESVKIGDLGISRSIDVQSGDDYYFSTDIWSLGILLCELCTLDRVIIRPEKRSKVFCKFFTCFEESFVELPNIERRYGKEMKKIAKLMLKDNPRERPNAAELVELFQKLPLHL